MESTTIRRYGWGMFGTGEPQKRLALVVNTEIWRLVPKSSPDAGEARLRHYLHYRLNGASEKFYCLNKVLIFNIILLC